MANVETKNTTEELQTMIDDSPLGEVSQTMSKVISKKKIILVHPGHG